MNDRDKIIAKLNALRAKANAASTPEEAITFLEGFNRLMEKYKMTETDLEVKSSKVEASVKTPAKKVELIVRVCDRIAKLTDTVVVRNGPSVAFLGLRVDLEYADWIYDLVLNSLDRGLNTFPMSATYHRLLNNGVKPLAIKENFKIGFLSAIATALDKMIAEKAVAGKGLVVLKNAIILAFIEENGGAKASKGKAVKLYDGAEEVAYEGFVEGSKVKLRQGVESVVKGYLS
jgi:hypothetical protein